MKNRFLPGAILRFTLCLFTLLMPLVSLHAQATLTTGTPFNIVNENSGLCIGASGQGTANGTVLQMYTCANGAYSTQLSQEWIFTAAASGYYEVADANATTEAWNVVNIGTTSGSLMQIWSYAGASNEEFEAVSLGNGYYEFIGQGSGLCLDVPGNSTANSVQLEIYTCNNTTAQAFKLVTPSASPGEGPYGGVAAAIPGTVLAENYDTGGQGVGYNVASVNGTANSYRSDGVDLEAASAPATGNDLGWSAAGQWFRYTVNVSTAGTYTVGFLVAAESAVGDAFHISNSSGTNLSGSVAVPDTGGWQTWTTVTATVTLPAGTQTLTLEEDAAGWNVDSFAFAESGGGGTEGPYGGTPAAIPGTVMNENYDTGGQGVGYNVTSSNGTDNGYRSDGVDLEVASAPATGNDLGWSASGQWFRYTVNVSTAGTYTVTFLVAAESAVGDAFHLSNSSGSNLSGSVAVPDTGGWQTWTTVAATVTLPAGTQTLTLNEDAAGWNIDSMVFTSGTAPSCTSTPSVPTGLAASGTTSSGTTLSWTASTVASGCTVSSYTVYENGSTLATVTSGTSYAVSGLAASTTYSYTVAATDSDGTSAKSSAVSVTTLASGGGGTTISNGGFTLAPQNAPSLVLDDAGAGTGAGNPLDVYTPNSTNAQSWALSDVGVTPTGYYNFAAIGAFCMTASGTTSGSTVVLDGCAGETAQAWEAVASGSNYTFHPASNTALCLTANGTAVGSAVLVDTCSGGTNQEWALTQISTGGGPTGGGSDCTGVANLSVGGVTYTPSWCLEFNGAAGPPPTNALGYDLGNNGGWGNGELEVYCGPPGYSGNPVQCPTTFSTSTAPVYIDGSGHLVIQPRDVGGTWISGRMNTDGGQLFQYGIIEASIELPNMTPEGLWPAFWGLGNNINSGVAWPTCGETDILEDWSPSVLGGAGNAGENSTIHTELTGGDGVSTRYTFPSGQAANTGFHTYGMIWSANEIQYFVDNPATPFATLTPGSLPAGDVWPFNQQIFLILNEAIGGTLGGSAPASTPGPMTVDYIRWYAAP